MLALVIAGLVTEGSPPERTGAGDRVEAGSLPLTFAEAEAAGEQVDWGPSCDTTRGTVAVPLWYAPPCVEPWTGGDNGGATASGVTRDEIVVAIYQAQPDLLEQTFLERSGSDEALGDELATIQQYVDFFNAHYQTFGRRVRLVPLRASGPPDDDVTAKADAIQRRERDQGVRVIRWTEPDHCVRRRARGSWCALRRRLHHRRATVLHRVTSAVHLADARLTGPGREALGRVRRQGAVGSAGAVRG